MKCSQQLDQSQGDKRVWFDTITVTDIPKGYFLAVTSNSLALDGTVRQVIITLMPASWADGGTHAIGTGAYLRGEHEKAVHTKVLENGVSQCECTQVYP